jgi:hypothetical protein
MIDPRNNFLMAASSINCTFFLKQYFHLGRDNRKVLCNESDFKKFCILISENLDSFHKLNALLLVDLFYKHWLPNKQVKNHTLIQFQ